MSVEVIDKIKPKNGGNFKIVDSVDIEMPDGSSLQEVIKYLTDNVEDITQGKFDPSKYYNMEEIIAKYYDKKEIDELLLALEGQLDAEQIEENVTNKVNSLFPLGIDLIDYDFDIYLQKENLIGEVKKILDEYDLVDGTGNSNIDMEKLNEIFYDKSETMNRDEIESLFKSINKELISNWISSSHYNRGEVDDKLAGKLDAEYEATIRNIASDLDTHMTDSSTTITNLENELKNLISDGLLTKANSSVVDALSANFEGFKNETFVEAIKSVCSEEQVKGIINDEIASGELGKKINDVVEENTYLIEDRIDMLYRNLGNYASTTVVNKELQEIKASLAVLGAAEYNGAYLTEIESMKKRIGEIEKILDSKEIDIKIEVITNIVHDLKDEYINLMSIMSDQNDRVKVLEDDFTDLNDTVSLVTDIISTNSDNISNMTNTLTDTLEEFEAVKDKFEILEGKISDTGFNELEHQVDSVQIGLDILNAEPVVDDMGIETYPEGSVYDKIFNSDNMRYDIVSGEETVSMLFNASAFMSDIKSINSKVDTFDGRISDMYTTVDNNSFRINVTQGDVYDIKNNISNLTLEIDRIDEFAENIASFSTTINEIDKRMNEIDELTPRSIISKINSAEQSILINSNVLNLRGSIDYNCLSGDLTSLLYRTSGGVFLNGKMISPNTIDAKSLNLKGITVKSIVKENGMTVNKYETFGISDSGNVSIVNPSIISTDFNTEEVSGYQLTSDGKAIFNNAEIRGKFVLPNAGLYGISDKDNNEIDSVRIWAGSTEEKRNEAPFRVQQDGFVFASNASIGGTIAATSLHSGAVHMESDEIRINNNFAMLNNKSNTIDEYLAGAEEKEFIRLNSRESVLNTNVKFSDSFKYDINLKSLDLNGKLNIKNNNTEISFNEKGIKMENSISKHEVYQDVNKGTMMFESGNNSSTSSSDFMFTSRNSVRDCNVKIKGSLEVTEEIKSNKNNVVLRSTENGFAFFSI